jgi:hypothetical protein
MPAHPDLTGWPDLTLPQVLLDGVEDYLPCPTDVANTALDLAKGEEKLVLPCSPSGPFVGGWPGAAGRGSWGS